MDRSSFIELLDKYLTNSISVRERKELAEQLENEENISLLETVIDQHLASGTFDVTDDEEIRNTIFERIERSRQFKGGKVRNISKWRRVAVAASVIFLLGLGTYFFFFNKVVRENQDESISKVHKDVTAPASTKAVITLADGRTIALDSLTTGTLATEGNVRVLKNESGEVVYSGAPGLPLTPSEGGGDVRMNYNTLVNPRGSKVVTLQLNDGTRVWLNSESSIRYPTVFAGNERKVEITGEAYFEVSKDASKKFFVDAGGTVTEVLGTHFNVNSYGDEGDTRVTLLEGRVRVTKGPSTGLLKPGQQAQVNTVVKVISGVNVETATAWKKGLFSFDRADIGTVMRQIGRWYDVEVVYNGTATKDVFGGDIQRELPLSKVLDFLQKSQVHFVLEGRKLTVLP